FRSLPGRVVTLILGGFDRGLDWSKVAAEFAAHPPHALVTQGAAGPRIARALHTAGVACPMGEATDFASAVAWARARTPERGVVLLSPGAPSFDAFKNYAERGRTFAVLAGFDAEAIGEIAGLGIA
ncbi:MAG TPA: UDP-N-acetylmuramoyl-L-alanine--D-glutamate ligase, partial [Rhodanobacteraceae bacterium]